MTGTASPGKRETRGGESLPAGFKCEHVCVSRAHIGLKRRYFFVNSMLIILNSLPLLGSVVNISIVLVSGPVAV